MATLALGTFASTSFLQSGTGLLTGLLAQAVDSYFIYPALFPEDDVEGPKLNDLNIADTTEGAPAYKVYGGGHRVPCSPVYVAPLREVRVSQSAGSKGGSGARHVVYQYHSHLVLRVNLGFSESIDKLLADGKPIWEANPDELLSSVSSVSSSMAGSYPRDELFNTYSGTRVLTLTVSTVTTSDPDFTKFVSGKSINLSGFVTTHPLTGLITADGGEAIGSDNITVKSTGAGTMYAGDVLHGYVVANDVVFTGTPSVPQTLDVLVFDPNSYPFNNGTLTAGITNGTSLTITSGAGTANNGDFLVVGTSFDDTLNTTSVTVEQRLEGTSSSPSETTSDILTAFNANTQVITLFQELPQSSGLVFDKIRIYNGDETHAQDPLIESLEEAEIGAGNILAWRHRTTIVLEDFNVTQFGNRIPNFEAIPIEDSAKTQVSELISDLLREANLGESEFDVSAVTDTFQGFRRRGRQTIKSVLQPIMTAFHLTAWDDNGVLTFGSQASPGTAKVIDVGDTRAGSAESQPEEGPVLVTTGSGAERYNEIIVKFTNKDYDYEGDSERKRRASQLPTGESRTINVSDLVIPATTALRLAYTLYDLSDLQPRTIQGSLPQFKYLTDLREARYVQLATTYRTWSLLLTKVDLGADDTINFEGQEYFSQPYSQDIEAEPSRARISVVSGESASSFVSPSSPVDFEVLDIPALQSKDSTEPTLYFAAKNTDFKKPWRGAQVFSQKLSTDEFNLIGNINYEATMGRVTQAPDTTVNSSIIDKISSLQFYVQFELASVTEDEMLQGANRFWVDGEIIGIQDLVLDSYDNTLKRYHYTGTNLLRGVLDTNDKISEDKLGKSIVYLNSDGVTPISVNDSFVGNARFFTVASSGQALTLASKTYKYIEGRSAIPGRVTNVTGSRNSSNDLTINWEYFTRRIIMDIEQDAQVGNEFTQFRLKYKNGSGTVVRTVDVTSAQTTTYTAAEQTTDGLTPGDPVDFDIFQISDRFREGRSRTVTL